MVKHSALACVFVLAIASATAQEAPPTAVGAELARATVASDSRVGFNPVVTEVGWSWYRAQRTWNYLSSGQWLLWMDFLNSSGWIQVANSSTDGADEQMHLAAATGNWLGIYWTSSSSWSASQLWYY